MGVTENVAYNDLIDITTFAHLVGLRGHLTEDNSRIKTLSAWVDTCDVNRLADQI
jgi:hypothetical protein